MTQCPLGHPPSWTCSSCPGVGQQYAPPAPAHFNARGELIPYVVVPEALGVAVVAEHNSPMKAVPGSPETEDDMGLDLELAYPDDEPDTAPPPPPPESSSSASAAPVPSSAPAPYTPPTPAPPEPSSSSFIPVPPRQPLPRRTTRLAVPRASAGTPLTNGASASASKSKPKPKPKASKVPPPSSTSASAPASASRNPTSTHLHPHASIALPRLPTSVPYAIHGYAHGHGFPPHMMPMPMPMPIPMHAMPPPMQMQMPMAIPPPPAMYAPAPVKQQIGCTTKGCKGKVSAAGKRCLACVRGSWAGRKEAQEKEMEKAKAKETPKAQRVIIKLKVTPKAVKLEGEVSVEKGDKKGKGKVQEAPAAVKPEVEGEPSDTLPTAVKDQAEKEGKVKAGSEEAPSEGKPKDDSDEANMWDGAGWNSDLSDLTNSDGESELEEIQETPRPSFKIRIPARTPSSSPTKPSPASALPTPPASISGTPEAPRLCTIARCRVPLPPHSLYRWKCCSACRKQYREYQRDRLPRLAASNAGATPSTTDAPLSSASSSAPRERSERTPAEVEALRAHSAQKEWEREENRRALEVAGVPVPPRKPRERTDPVGTWNVAPNVQLRASTKQVEGARVCAARACEHVIPGEQEYEWLLCGPCLARERRKAERALVKEGKAPVSSLAMSAAQQPKDDFPVAEVQKPGRCMYADCGILMPVDAEVSVAECSQCLRRKMQQRKTPGRPPGARNKPKLKVDADGKPLSARNPPPTSSTPEKPLEAPRKRKRVSPYPAYQSREALLKDFGTRFHSFIEAQSYYFLMRGAMTPQVPAQAMFDFSGEYSIVAMDFDVVARKAEIELGVHSVKDAVAHAGGLEFSPTSWVSILGKPGGVVTRFACVHLVKVFLPIRMPPGHPPNPAHTKSMQGELEIAVLPDDSHKYFPGEKTIVRFRLVG